MTRAKQAAHPVYDYLDDCACCSIAGKIIALATAARVIAARASLPDFNERWEQCRKHVFACPGLEERIANAPRARTIQDHSSCALLGTRALLGMLKSGDAPFDRPAADVVDTLIGVAICYAQAAEKIAPIDQRSIHQMADVAAHITLRQALEARPSPTSQ